MDTSRLVTPVTRQITERPGRVVAAFLLVTAVLAVGLGNIQTEAGFESFTQDIPAEEALEDIDREFGNRFGASIGSTQLIQSAPNVLAKPELLRMLRAQERLAEHDALRVTSTSSAASIVAVTIDPSATTIERQIRTIERSTPSEIDRAIRTAADRNPRFASLLSNDFNPTAASASATIGVVQHSVPAGLAAGAGMGGSSPLTSIQLRVESVVDTVGGDIRVFGTGIFADEFSTVIVDSLLLTIPAAVILIVLFLVIAYRDLLDLLLGAFALVMTVVWTFGFMGLAGVPFSQLLIAVPPLLLAVGIDFGIHAINRYREEREVGADIAPAMRRTGEQLVVAFALVAGTTVIGFLSNLSSSLAPIREFGLIASAGILFTFLVFGIFLPAAKVFIDRLGDRYPLPVLSQRPLGSEGSALGRALSGGVSVARVAPVVMVLLALVGTAGAGYYATGVDTKFTQEDFLPPAELNPLLKELPEPFRPSDYTVVEMLDFLEEHFASAQDDSITVLLRGPMERDVALEAIHRAGRDPPDAFVRDGRYAEATSIVTVIRDRAARDPEFAALVDRHDRDGDGIPDDDLGRVYDALFASPAGDRARSYLTEDRRSTRVVYSVKSDPSQEAVAADAATLADRFRVSATATGNTVVFQAIADILLRSAAVSLVIALALVAVFLLVSYRLLEGYATLGVANLVPIVVTVAALGATMRLLGISFNAFTATILAITIGLGIDYSVHVTHRFADELAERDPMPALARTVRGTGGALTGSMFTTVFGIGVLVLAVFPAIGQFGVLTGLSVLYAYLASLVVLPSVLAVWARLVRPERPPEEPGPSVEPDPTPFEFGS
ncbi:MAG: RND family transporter [Halobacteriales archaeon]